MRKLELKDIACYLPYGLKVYVYGQTRWENYISEMQRLTSDGAIYFSHCYNLISGNENYFKPLLRPLSDLTKEIEHNGKRFVPIDIVNFGLKCMILDVLDVNKVDDNVKLLPYYFLEHLFKWHFDTNGLIEAGLAIDLNTINEKQ